MANGKILGLDIGISSVGVGVIDANTGDIIHASSRIFPAANADNNKTRRTSRGARRLTRRKKHRIERLEDLFEKYEIETTFENLNLNPYELRVKGLKEELTNEELFAALKNIVKRRGISYLDDAEDEQTAGSSAYAKAVDLNRQLLQSKTPGEIQLERFQKYGQLRGNFTVIDDGIPQQLINVFSTSEYAKEAKRILETQQQSNSQITEQFIEDYITLLKSKRKYYIGPGSEKSPTPYGIYKPDGKELKDKNLFSVLIGKCTFYPEEYRAARASYTAQEFNFLNDLNNLKVPTETGKLSIEQKYQLVEFAKNDVRLGATKLLKQIAKLVGCQVDEIKGYRIDKNDKPEMHTFEVYRKMRNILETISIEELRFETQDKLAEILTLNTDKEGIVEKIQLDLPNQFSAEQIQELVALRKGNGTLFSGWHNLSVKLMRELIPELYNTSEEQMTILTRLEKFKPKMSEIKRTKYIDEKQVVEEIYNPVVSKSVRQAIKILNAAIKEWGDFDKVVIEMPRENNEDDHRKKIVENQKRNKNEKDSAEKEAATLYNGQEKLPSSVFHGYKDLALRVRLWYQQEHKCIYSGKEITIHELIHNRELFEVDHIIPLSLSFDDGLSNKVLVYRWANQEKGQRTPFQALDTMKAAWTFRELKDYLKHNTKIDNKKKDYLLTQEDISKIDVQQQFIARNLVDTRYASRTVLNTLQDNFKAMNKETQVAVVRGQFTSQLRKNWKIDKTRETNHHHAIDALIVAASSQLKLWKKTKNELFVDYNDRIINVETGEIISDEEYKNLVFSPPYQAFVDTIKTKEFESKILFSYQVDSKVNRSLSDAIIYGTRIVKKDNQEETYVLTKIGDIYTQKGFDDFIGQYNKDKTAFLMYQKDLQTWEKVIEPILRDYPRTELNDKGKEVSCNPFKKYFDEYGFIKKYSKKGKGTAIKSLKYIDKKLGKYIDVTLENSVNTAALLKLNSWRTDVYFNPETMRYEVMGLKYSDIRFYEKKGKYEIYPDLKTILSREKISSNSKFKFSLYNNDLILIKDTISNQQVLLRFVSKIEGKSHYISFKPYEKETFEGGETLVDILGDIPKSGKGKSGEKGINKPNLSIYKVKSDILGNLYFIKSEGDYPQFNF